MKKFFYTCLFSALLFSTLTALFSPKAITWYFTPPADMVISCRSAVEWGIDAYRQSVLIGAMVGAIVGAAVYHFFTKKKLEPSKETTM
jgi:hypothetical protein